MYSLFLYIYYMVCINKFVFDWFCSNKIFSDHCMYFRWVMAVSNLEIFLFLVFLHQVWIVSSLGKLRSASKFYFSKTAQKNRRLTSSLIWNHHEKCVAFNYLIHEPFLWFWLMDWDGIMYHFVNLEPRINFSYVYLEIGKMYNHTHECCSFL